MPPSFAVVHSTGYDASKSPWTTVLEYLWEATTNRSCGGRQTDQLVGSALSFISEIYCYICPWYLHIFSNKWLRLVRASQHRPITAFKDWNKLLCRVNMERQAFRQEIRRKRIDPPAAVLLEVWTASGSKFLRSGTSMRLDQPVSGGWNLGSRMTSDSGHSPSGGGGGGVMTVNRGQSEWRHIHA